MIETVTSKRYDGLDFLKLIACITVVFIHSQFPGWFGDSMRAVGRVAVPFFLMVSGFFCVNKSLQFETNNLNRKIKHILIITLFGFLFYACYYLATNCLHYHKSPLEVAAEYWADFSLKALLIINTPSCYLHLWFLLALVYCYIFVYPRFMRKFFLNRYALIVSIVVCLAVFVLSSEILPFWSKEIELFGYKAQHIFLFRALPFFLIGLYARLYQPFKDVCPQKLLIIALWGLLFSLVELCFQVQDSQAYVGSIVCASLLLLFGLKSTAVYPKKAVAWGGQLSLYVYIYHNAVMATANRISPSDWVTPIIVVAISFVMSALTLYLKEVLYSKKCKKG